MKYQFIVKESERTPWKATLSRIEQLGSGLDYDVFTTREFGEEEERLRTKLRTLNGEPVRVIVCGENATLHFALNGLFGFPNVELGYVPLDNVFDVFSTVPGVPRAHLGDVDRMIHGCPTDMDLLQVNDRYCINVGNIGLDANVTKLRLRLQKLLLYCPWLRIAEEYLYGLAKYGAFIMDAPEEKITILINGYEKIVDSYTLVHFANTKQYGAGYICAPLARSDDGLIEFLHGKRMPIRKMPRVAKIYRRGDILSDDYVHGMITYRRCLSLDISVPQPVFAALDSAVYLKSDTFKVRILPAAIRFVLPEPDVPEPDVPESEHGDKVPAEQHLH